MPDRSTFANRIAQAIGDPGSIVGRKLGTSWGAGNDGYSEHDETVTRWSTRAVLAVLNEQADPMPAILGEVAAERAAQDAKWGEQNHPDADPVILARLNTAGMYGTPWAVAQRLAQEYEIPTAARAKLICQTEAASSGATWIGIAVEELAEVLEAATAGDPAKLRAELLQVAAVAIAWVEAIDRRTASAANHG